MVHYFYTQYFYHTILYTIYVPQIFLSNHIPTGYNIIFLQQTISTTQSFNKHNISTTLFIRHNISTHTSTTQYFYHTSSMTHYYYYTISTHNISTTQYFYHTIFLPHNCLHILALTYQKSPPTVQTRREPNTLQREKPPFFHDIAMAVPSGVHFKQDTGPTVLLISITNMQHTVVLCSQHVINEGFSFLYNIYYC